MNSPGASPMPASLELKAGYRERRFADFSDCGNFRYSLRIVWDDDLPLLVVIGLNPSVANQHRDDPTVRRWKAYAKAWGYGGIVILNLFAFINTNPKGLLVVPNPVGPLNSVFFLKSQIANTDYRWALACWGNVHKTLKWREAIVKRELTQHPCKLKCLGTTLDGSPKHVLRLAGNLKPLPYGG